MNLGKSIGGVISLGVLGLFWWLATDLGYVSEYVIPSPGSVLDAFILNISRGTLFPHLVITLKAVTWSLVYGSVGGILLGGLVAQSDLLRRGIYPVVTGIQSVPKIAVAPLIIAYFGIGVESKILIGGILVFFPIFINTINGMERISDGLNQYFSLNNASRLDRLVYLLIPGTLGDIFDAMQLGVVLALIGTVTGEFIGAEAGLGFLIQSRAGELDLSLMFVCIMLLGIIGGLGMYIFGWIGKKVVFWRDAG